MSNTTDKEVERFQTMCFLDDLNLKYTILQDFEEPDFKVYHENELLFGLEVTEAVNESDIKDSSHPAARLNLIHSLIVKAEELFSELCSKCFNITFEFADQIRMSKSAINTNAKALAEEVYSNIQDCDFTEKIDLTIENSNQTYIDRIRIKYWPSISHSIWYNAKASILHALTAVQIQSIIKSKEKRVANYRANVARPQILLIVEGDYPRSQFGDVQHLKKMSFNFSFDFVYIYRMYRNEIIRLNKK